MDEIEKRLRETADACIKSYEEWRKSEREIASIERLRDAVHELRKVSSRLEIEMAVSERGEMAQRPIPIPSHRASRNNRPNPYGGQQDDMDNLGNRSSGGGHSGNQHGQGNYSGGGSNASQQGDDHSPAFLHRGRDENGDGPQPMSNAGNPAGGQSGRRLSIRRRPHGGGEGQGGDNGNRSE